MQVVVSDIGDQFYEVREEWRETSHSLLFFLVPSFLSQNGF